MQIFPNHYSFLLVLYNRITFGNNHIHFKPNNIYYDQTYIEVTLVTTIYLYRWFEWDAVKSDDVHGWGLKSSEKVLNQLEDVGQQLALTFDDEGSVLAAGGEVGFIIPVISGLL